MMKHLGTCVISDCICKLLVLLCLCVMFTWIVLVNRLLGIMAKLFDAIVRDDVCKLSNAVDRRCKFVTSTVEDLVRKFFNYLMLLELQSLILRGHLNEVFKYRV
jgi:hypothetical protein